MKAVKSWQKTERISGRSGKKLSPEAKDMAKN